MLLLYAMVDSWLPRDNQRNRVVLNPRSLPVTDLNVRTCLIFGMG